MIYFGKNWDKGRTHGAFGKKPPKKVGNGKCHKKGIGSEPRPKQAGNYHIADQAGYTAATRSQTHYSGSLVYAGCV
jgi:hypothetical protein